MYHGKMWQQSRFCIVPLTLIHETKVHAAICSAVLLILGTEVRHGQSVEALPCVQIGGSTLSPCLNQDFVWSWKTATDVHSNQIHSWLACGCCRVFNDAGVAPDSKELTGKPGSNSTPRGSLSQYIHQTSMLSCVRTGMFVA